VLLPRPRAPVSTSVVNAIDAGAPTGTAAGATATRPHPPTSLPDAATSKLGATALVNFATAVIRVHAAAASPDRVTAVGKQVRA
jgi:hypothetical protein